MEYVDRNIYIAGYLLMTLRLQAEDVVKSCHNSKRPLLRRLFLFFLLFYGSRFELGTPHSENVCLVLSLLAR